MGMPEDFPVDAGGVPLLRRQFKLRVSLTQDADSSVLHPMKMLVEQSWAKRVPSFIAGDDLPDTIALHQGSARRQRNLTHLADPLPIRVSRQILHDSPISLEVFIPGTQELCDGKLGGIGPLSPLRHE